MTWTLDDTVLIEISGDRELTIAFLNWQKHNSIYPLSGTSSSSFDGCRGTFASTRRSQIEMFFLGQ